VLSSGEFTQINPEAKAQLWGYSGGGLASGWAAQLHSTYAPELDIVGAVLGNQKEKEKNSHTVTHGWV
jgi:hypothetical protein